MTEYQAYHQVSETRFLDYHTILDGLGDPLVVTDEGNRILYVNPAVERLLGWTRAELVGQPLVVIIPERFREAHVRGFARYITTRIPRIIGRPVRLPALHRDGNEVDVELALTTSRDSSGDMVIVGALRDLRDRTELERQLSVNRYLSVAAQATARLTTRLDLDQLLGTVVDTLVIGFGASLARVWLYEEATNSLHLRAAAGPSQPGAEDPTARLDVASSTGRVAAVARTRTPFTENASRGKWEGTAIFPLLLGTELRGVVEFLAREPLSAELIEVLTTFLTMVGTSFHDVELLASEQAARTAAEEAHRRFAFLAEASSMLSSSLDYGTTLTNVARLTVPRLADWCVVHIVEEDGTIRQLAIAHNDPARVELAEELQRRYPFDPDAPSGVAQVIRSGVSEITPEITDELIRSAVDDPQFVRVLLDLHLRSSMVVPLVAREHTLGAISFLAAESERHYGPDDEVLAEDLARRAAMAVDNARLFRELQETIRMRDEFLSSISHDLKNPLTALKAQAQVLQRRVSRMEAPETERLIQGLESMVGLVSKMDRLINDLLDVAHLQMGRALSLQPDRTDLVKLLCDLAAGQQEVDDSHTIRCRSDAPTLVGAWDGHRLERVFGNILFNAVKYSPEGGTIELRVRQEAIEGKPHAVVTVEDTGLGIPEGELAHIFDRYYRASNVAGQIEGTGIGLAGAKQIVEQHGGAITIQSRLGVGTTVTIRLPLPS